MYKAMAPLGFTPRQVDDMEFWECAAILGVEDRGGGDGRVVTAMDDAFMRSLPR